MLLPEKPLSSGAATVLIDSGRGGSSSSGHVVIRDAVLAVSNLRRALLLVAAVVVSALLAGVTFGWPALELVLLQQGVYSSLCSTNHTDVLLPAPSPVAACGAQTTQLALIFTVGATGYNCALLPAGVLLDRFGPRVVAVLGSALIACGALLFAFAVDPGFDAFVPGFFLISIGGPFILFSTLHLANLFPSRRGTVIAVLNAALGASSLVFVVFELLDTQVAYRWMMVAFAVLPLMALVLAVLLWPARAFVEEQPAPPMPPPEATDVSTTDDDGSGAFIGGVSNSNSLNNEQTRLLATAPPPPLRSQLAQPLFWACVAFTAFQLVHMNFYIATVARQLLAYPDATEQLAKFYTRIFALVAPCVGVVVAPAIGFGLDRLGMRFSIWAVTLCGCACAAWPLFVFLTVHAQLLTFVLLAVFRTLVFAVMTTFVATQFASAHFGTLWGLTAFVGGLCNLSVYFVVRYVENQPQEHFFWINVGIMACSAACVMFPLALHRVAMREYRK